MNKPIGTLLLISALALCISCAKARPAQHSFDGVGTSSLGRDLVPSVNFSFGSDRVGRRNRWVIRNNALWMKANPDAFIILEGHCDRRGDSEFNIELGDGRARNVREELVRLGVAPDSFAIVSYGESRPIDKGSSKTSFKNNRRVAFIVR